MMQLLNILSLIKWIIEMVIKGYEWASKKKEEAAEQKHDDAVSDLKNSKTEEEQKDATRRMADNP